MYRKEVEYMDQEIGKLLSRIKDLNLIDSTAIVVVGDHGEGLGEYRFPGGAPHIGHIHFLYSLYLEVPYLIHNPSIKTQGDKIATPVTLLDVGPTILGLLGWKQPDFMKGQNVLKLKKRNRAPSEIFGETYEPQSFYTSFCLIRYPWQMIITPKKNRFELYNLSEDPLERQNIYSDAEDREDIVDLKIKLNNYIRTSLAQKLPEKEKDKDTLEMLKALGYIK
jgi:arylsulfatase A-like enzyme